MCFVICSVFRMPVPARVSPVSPSLILEGNAACASRGPSVPDGRPRAERAISDGLGRGTYNIWVLSAHARGARDQRWIRTRHLKYLGTKVLTRSCIKPEAKNTYAPLRKNPESTILSTNLVTSKRRHHSNYPRCAERFHGLTPDRFIPCPVELTLSFWQYSRLPQ